MFLTIFVWSLTLIVFSIVFLSYFLIFKPLLGIRFYRNQGCQMTFVPLLGTTKACLDSFSVNGDFYGHWKQAVQKNPSIQLFGGNFLDKPFLCLVDPKLIKEYYKKSENYVKVPMMADIFRIISGEGLTVSEGETWKRHRKIIAAAFHHEFLREMIPSIVKITDQLTDDFKKKDLNRICLLQEFEIIAGEIIGRLFFGEKFSDYRIQDQIVTCFLADLGFRVGSQGPTLMYMIFGMKGIEWGLLPKYRQIMRDIKEFYTFAAEIIERKREMAKVQDSKPTKPKTLIERLLFPQDQNSDQTLTTEEIIGEFITFVGAGSSTSAGLLGMAALHLCKYPDYKAKLLEEIDKYFENPSQITIETLNQMEFMTAFMKEALRLSPPLPGIIERQAIQDHTLGDLKIKKGTVINIGILANNYNPSYHEEESVFKPERWLTNSKTKESVSKDPYVSIPFSSGNRNCIGQHLAVNEIKIIFGLLLKKYDFTLCPDYEHKMTQRMFYEPLNPMYFKLTPRSVALHK